MTPGEASATGQAMRVLIDDMIRPAAHVFDLPNGVVYVDMGWSENIGGQPIHFLFGSFKEIETFDEDTLWAATIEDDDVFIETSDETPDGTREQAWVDISRIFPEYI